MREEPVREEPARKMQPYSVKLPCPCESGKRFKNCCYRKGIKYEVDDEGQVFRAIPLNTEARSVLEEHRKNWIAQHGREPGPGDRVFPNAPSVTDIANMMREAGISPALIYAFEKTDGLMVTEMNRHLIPDKDIREFEDAYAEYMALSEAQEQRS